MLLYNSLIHQLYVQLYTAHHQDSTGFVEQYDIFMPVIYNVNYNLLYILTAYMLPSGVAFLSRGFIFCLINFKCINIY